jgi:predicted amidohydrolase
MKCTVALAQVDPTLGDLRKNVEKHLAAVEQARGAGATLVAFPELSLTGYSLKDMNMEVAVNLAHDTPSLRPLVDASRSGVSIIAGAVEEGDSFGIYNSVFLFEDGRVRSVHRKVYPPTYGMFEEMRYFSSGRSVRAFDSRLGRIGVLICEDLWHMSLPYLLALDGARLIVVLTASPTRIGPEQEGFQAAVVNSENHKAYARLLSVYLAFCNRVGYEDGVNFWGGSELIQPDGDVLAKAKLFEEDLILAEVNDDEIRRARRSSRHFLDENPELVMQELRRIMGEGRRNA